ncbi:MAG TPA: extracellular solute-binding protein [Anaerolineaceae bacterium]
MGWKQLSFTVRRVLFAMLLAALVAGCGGTRLSTQEPVELRFLYTQRVADYAPLAEEFHRQHPNITITLDEMQATGFGNSPRDLLDRADAADAVRLPVDSISDEMAQKFQAIDTMISTGKSFDREDLFPGSLDALKLNGKQVGLPAGINPFVVYYMPAKFKAAGVQEPAPNWTLDDFVAAASAVHNPDNSVIGTDRYAYGFCSSPQLTDLPMFMYLFGGGLFDSLTQISNPTLNQRANVDALSWYASLKTDRNLMPDQNDARQVYMLVHRNGCGLWIDWLDRSIFDRDFALASQPLPLPRYKTEFNFANIDGYFILSKTQHPEETLQWITFLMQQQSASGNLIPPMKSLVNSSDYAARAPKQVVAVARSLPPKTVVLGMDIYRNDRFGKVIQLVSQAASNVIKGDGTAQSALDDAQQQAELLFK